MRVYLTHYEYCQIRDGILGTMEAADRLTTGNVAHKRGMLRDFLVEAKECLDRAGKRARQKRSER